MNRRIQKKKRLGPYAHYGFEVKPVDERKSETFWRGWGEPDRGQILDRLFDDWLAFVEALGLVVGGGPTSFYAHICTCARCRRGRMQRGLPARAKTNESHRWQVDAWLRGHIPEVPVVVGPLERIEGGL